MMPEEITRMRTELGLSVEEFARVMGVSIAAVRYWDSGQRRIQG